jgi:multiphosphoryl transfer protein
MIGIVLVSHSATLAEGVRELAMQMANEHVALAVAGGTANPDAPIGTDPERVLAAIQRVYSADGVLVLMDLGSAVMSAEMALELLPEEQRQHVYLCEAPLVEGAIAATTRAMAGGSLAEVLAEANSALAAKQLQLKPTQVAAPPAPAPPLPQSVNSPAPHQITIIVPNRLGLHARPAARLVELAGNFLAHVTVHKAEEQAPWHSMNQLMMLGARQGEMLTFSAAGQEAKEALSAIQALEETELPPSSTAGAAPTISDTIRALAASPGVAVGPILLLQTTLPAVVERVVSDPPAEWWRLQDALSAALIELDARRREIAHLAGESASAIFAAQRAMLQDQILQDAAHEIIHTTRINAEAAWQKAVDRLAERYLHHPIEHFRERAADIADIGQRVMRHLTATQASLPQFDQPGILVTRDLSPSETALLSPDKVLGLVTELGGATGHSAILARSLGIPAVVGAGNLLSRLQPHQLIGIDGAQGLIWLNPDGQHVEQLTEQRSRWLRQRSGSKNTAQLPATLRDGKRIEIGANISNASEVAQALTYGAEGVGLFRSEFLYIGRTTPPSEDEHYAAYTAAARALGEHPLIVRTLDIGGDKPIPYLGIAPEANPFLGWRGIRFCLDRPEIFRPQLRALLRASVDYNILIMFPMVSTLSEVQAARCLLSQVQTELHRSGLPTGGQTPIGIMIETPAAVLMADQLARAVDFFSIGTNDLTQYTLAADRGNAQVAGLVNALQPAVLRSIRQVTQAAHAAGIWVGVCGELAGNPAAAALLVGLGVDELSMTAPAIPAVKAHLRDLELAQAVQLAEQALALTTVTEVEALLER